MIDLKELDKEIDALLENETSESLLAWLKSKEDSNIERYTGQGEFISFPGIETKCILPSMNIEKNSQENNAQDYNYANAA